MKDFRLPNSDCRFRFRCIELPAMVVGPDKGRRDSKTKSAMALDYWQCSNDS